MPTAAPPPPPTQNRIVLRPDAQNNAWVASHQGPFAQQIIDEFGDTDLPTPFGLETDPQEIAAKLRELNPGVEVVVEGQEAPPPPPPSPAPPEAMGVPQEVDYFLAGLKPGTPITTALLQRRFRVGRSVAQMWLDKLGVPEGHVAGEAIPAPPAPAEGGLTLTPPAPPAPAPTAEDRTPPEGIMRADLGRAPGGKEWVVNAYDKGGKTIRTLTFPTRPAAQPILDAWKKQAVRNRHEARQTGLSVEEHQAVTQAPGVRGWPTYESLGITREWYERGKKGPTPALYKALANARQLGVEIHPKWLEEFPDLRGILPSGRKHPIKRTPERPEAERPERAGIPREVPDEYVGLEPVEDSDAYNNEDVSWASLMGAENEIRAQVAHAFEVAAHAKRATSEKGRQRAIDIAQGELENAQAMLNSVEDSWGTKGRAAVEARVRDILETTAKEIEGAKKAPARPSPAAATPTAAAPAPPAPSKTPKEFRDAFEKNQAKFNIGRGAHGAVKVQFPDKGHAALYRLGKRMDQMKPGEATQLAQLVERYLDIPAKEAPGAASRYREQINEFVKDAEEGAVLEAPAYDATRPAPEAPPRSAPEPEGPPPEPGVQVPPGVQFVYASGMSRISDLRAALHSETPVGVDINELSKDAMEEIANAFAAGMDPMVFVDSGAFSAFKKGQKQDLEAVLNKYRDLFATIVAATTRSKEDWHPTRLVLTVPDVIGDQAATLEAFRAFLRNVDIPTGKFAALFPLQVGPFSLAQMVDRVREIVIEESRKPNRYNLDLILSHVVWGIPSNAAAAPKDQIAELGRKLKTGGYASTHVHFLGAGGKKTLGPLVEALNSLGPKLPELWVTGDSNRLRATTKGGGRPSALENLTGVPAGTKAPPSPEPVSPEVRRLQEAAEDAEAKLEASGEWDDLVAAVRARVALHEANGEPVTTLEALNDVVEEVTGAVFDPESEDLTALATELGLPKGEEEAPGPETQPPPVPPPAKEPFDPIQRLDEEVRKGITAALNRVPNALWPEVRGLVGEQVMRLEQTKSLRRSYEYFKGGTDSMGLKIPNSRNLARSAKAALDNAESLYKMGRETIDLTLKHGGVEDHHKITKRIHDLLEGKGLRTAPTATEKAEARAASPLEPMVMANVETWADETAVIFPNEAVERVVEYAKEITVDDEDVLSHLEFIGEEMSRWSDARLRRVVDIPGLGRAKIEKALHDGPDDPNFETIRKHVAKWMTEMQGFRELIAVFAEPAEHPELLRIAANLAEDMSAEPEGDGVDPHILKTFMAGIRFPGTEREITTQEAIDAIRDGRGRLFARILAAYESAMAAAAPAGPDLDVPFDIPEGEGGMDITESPVDKFGQVLIPGMLEAVMGTPAKPIKREGGKAPDFSEHPLFTQEEEKKAREEEERAKKAQKTLFSPHDEFGGRYGPPPRKPTQAQLDARQRWAEKMLGLTKGGTSGTRVAGSSAAGAPQPVEGEAPAPAERPERPGAGAAHGPGEAGGAGGGGRGRGVPSGVPGGGEGARAAAPRSAKQGIFDLFNPREEATFRRPPKLELIPERLRGVDANGDPLLSEHQRVGAAKAIEAVDAGVGFLFADGTGVGKTREILAVAEYYRLKGRKVLIVSPASAIAVRRVNGELRPSGSYDDDSRAMEIPLKFRRASEPLNPGVVHLSTYHNLRDQPVDKDTVLFFDESHALKNAGDSEAAAAGIELIRKAGATVFATATPGDKAYHMGYLTTIGILEGKTLEKAMADLGCVVVKKKRISKRAYERALKAGKSPQDALKEATELFDVYRTTSTRKMYREVEALFDRLTEKGTVIKREMDLSAVEVKLVTVPIGPESYQKMDIIANGKFDRKNALMHMRRQMEPEKLPHVQHLIEQELAEGRSVVVFAARVNESKVVERIRDRRTGDLIERVLLESEGTLKQLREWLKEKGIEYAEIHGAADEKSPEAQARFQSNKVRVVIATYEKGGTGINLDDRTGLAPRTMIMMTAPFDSVNTVQALGRVHRLTTRSGSRIYMLFTPHPVDQWNAAILGTKIKQLRAMVSGDIGLLDPEVLAGGEEALQQGDAAYKDVRVALMNHGAPPGVETDLGSARHWGAVVHQLKHWGVKITRKGGPFEVYTREGFVIQGELRKQPQPQGWSNAYLLKWEDDVEAGDLVEHIKAQPAELPKPSAALPKKERIQEALGYFNAPGYVKRIVSRKQYEYFKGALDRLGAVWGFDGKPGNFAIMSAEGRAFEGELAPPAKYNAEGRAEPGDEGAFIWRMLPNNNRTEQTNSAVSVLKTRRGMNDLLRRMRRGEQYKDFFEVHEETLRDLFGDDADLFGKLLAVTSQAADVRANVALALRAYRQMRLGLPFTGFLPPVRAALYRIARNEPSYARGRKMVPYDAAAMGRDLDAVAADRHVSKFVLGKALKGDTPTKRQSELVQQVIKEAARLLGWTGREASAAAWAAQKLAKGQEVITYDEALRARATEIRRFRRYFGDVGLERGWVHAPGGPAHTGSHSDGEKTLDPGAIPAGAAIFTGSQFVVTRPYLNWSRPQRVGKGVPLPRMGQTLKEGYVWLGAKLAEDMSRVGRVDWQGYEIKTLEDLVAIGQIARNTSVEHGHILYVDKWKRVIWDPQVTSRMPTSITWGARSAIVAGIRSQLDRLKAAGYEGVTFYDLHNHPSGDPTPSVADVSHMEFLRDEFGDEFEGSAVIDHERGTVIHKDGTVVLVQRSERAIAQDPLLSAGVDAPDYWGDAGQKGRGQYGIETHEKVSAYGRRALELAWAKQSPGSPIVIFADARLRLRAAVVAPRLAFTNPASFQRLVEAAARAVGAVQVFAVWEGDDRFLRNAALAYLQNGFLSEAIMLGVGGGRDINLADVATAVTMGQWQSRILPWDVLSQDRTGLPWSFQMDESDTLGPDNDNQPPRPGAAGGGGRQGPPNLPPTGGGGASVPDDPDAPWWRRRVNFARARMRAGQGQNIVAMGARALWDAFTLGVDAFLRGFRSFLRWVGQMMRDIPNIGTWGRRLWNYLTYVFGPRFVEHRGRPEDFDVAARAAGVSPRRPIRPIPPVRRQDIEAAARRLEEGPPGEPGAGRPLGVGRPGDLGININRIEDENGLRQVFTDIVRALEDRFNRARRQMTEEEMRREALLAGFSQDDILRLMREKGALNYSEILAARILRQEAGLDFTQKYQAFRDAKAAESAEADPARRAALSQTRLETEREMRASLQKLIGIMYGTAAAGSEAGRALYAHKMLVQGLSPEERFLQRLLRGTNPDERLIAELADAIQRGDMVTVNRLYRRLHRPGFWRTINEYFINSVLSGPATLAANVMGNLTHEALRTAERGVAGALEHVGFRQLVERFLTGTAQERQRYIGEAAEALRAQAYYKFGITDALKLMWEATWKEDPRFMTGAKGEFHPPAIPGVLGKVVRTPGRWMQALDLGAKYAASQGEQAAQIFRRVMREMEERGEPYTREEFARRTAAIKEDLVHFIELEENRLAGERLTTEEYSWMARNRYLADVYRAMKNAADESTFQDDTTRFTKYLQSMRNQYPYLTLIIPFIKTPERILVQAARRTPVGLARTLYNIRTGKISGGLASDRLAQGLLGSAVMAGLYMLARDGMITGGGPADPEERRNWLATGKQPYAIRVGDRWISLARIEPLATTLGFSADLAEAQDAKVAGDLVDKLHFSIVNNITNKTYLEGIVSLSEAMGDPERYGGRVWKRIVGAAVPNLLASAARAIDPTIRQTDTITETLMARTPILSEQVPARLTGTGEEVKRGETTLSRFASPFRYSEEAGPERNLERLFLETGYNPSAPPKSLTLPGTMGRRVELTPEERRIYSLYARRATDFARTLTRNNDWSGLDVYAKEEILKRIYRFAHDAARRQMFRSVFYRMRKGEVRVA